MTNVKFQNDRARAWTVQFLALTFLFCLGATGFSQQSASQQSASQQSAEVPLTLETLLQKYRQQGEEKWESQIQKLEQRGASEASGTARPADSILFYGSSSIRRWETIAADMLPYPAINRGYGGAKYVDMVLFAERILKPHPYRALVLFAANDVKEKGKQANSSVEEVEIAVGEILRISKQHRPDAPIFIVEITPTESRFAVWDKTRALNAALREIALTTENVWFVATAEHYLRADGTPKSELFVEDKLHLNARGYKKWAELLKSQLNSFLPAKK